MSIRLRVKFMVVVAASLFGGLLYFFISAISWILKSESNSSPEEFLFALAVAALYSTSFGALLGFPILLLVETISKEPRKPMIYFICGGGLGILLELLILDVVVPWKGGIAGIAGGTLVWVLLQAISDRE